MKFILASKSPRRKEILDKINIDFKVMPSNINESIISKKINRYKYVTKLASLKSDMISKKNPKYTVIGADTIVVINENILNKPKNFYEAKEMLTLLSANTHEVITAVSIKNNTLNIDENFYDSSFVTFYKVTETEIVQYIDNYKPFDKAGSYGIQDYAKVFIRKIEGSYDNIMGFPVSKFYQVLKKYF